MKGVNGSQVLVKTLKSSMNQITKALMIFGQLTLYSCRTLTSLHIAYIFHFRIVIHIDLSNYQYRLCFGCYTSDLLAFLFESQSSFSRDFGETFAVALDNKKHLIESDAKFNF